MVIAGNVVGLLNVVEGGSTVSWLGEQSCNVVHIPVISSTTYPGRQVHLASQGLHGIESPVQDTEHDGQFEPSV